MFAAGVLGPAANWGAAVGIECSKLKQLSIAGSAIRLTDDVDVPTLSST